MKVELTFRDLQSLQNYLESRSPQLPGSSELLL